MNAPTVSDAPDIIVRDNMVHDGSTYLLSADFQSPDIVVRREPIPGVLLDEVLASPRGWARDPSEDLYDVEAAYCYLRARHHGDRGAGVTFHLYQSSAMGCAPPRTQWSHLGQHDVALTPGGVAYTPVPIEWRRDGGDGGMLIFEVASDGQPRLEERGSDVAQFHRDLAGHGLLRFRNVATAELDASGAADHRMPLRNFADAAQEVRIRLVGGLPVGAEVSVEIADLDAATQTTIQHRPEKLWVDAELPAGYSGHCSVHVQLPKGHAAGGAGYQLRTCHRHRGLGRLIDGGALNVRLLGDRHG